MNTLLRLLLLTLAGTGLSGCGKHPPAGAPTPSPVKVSVAQPHTGIVTNWDEYPGHLQAVEAVDIRPRVSGYIDTIHFQDGAEVQAGDLLFVIDPRLYRAELLRAQAQRQQAETRVELARNDLQRAEGLHGTKAISEEEYDTRSKAVREAEAALAATKAAESVAQLEVDYTRVTAPIAGRIGCRLVTAGNLVQGGGMMPGTLLASLVSVDPIHCYFTAEETALSRYRKLGDNRSQADRTNGFMACELGLAGEEDFPHRGYVDFFDNQVDGKTGTILIRGVFANGDRTLVPGMFARVRVPAGPPVAALLVPAVAIQSDQGKKSVLVVNEESVIQSKPVETGRQHGSMRVITQGLTTEDRVVVNGLIMARPGVKVEVVDAPAPESAATAARR